MYIIPTQYKSKKQIDHNCQELYIQLAWCGEKAKKILRLDRYLSHEMEMTLEKVVHLGASVSTK